MTASIFSKDMVQHNGTVVQPENDLTTQGTVAEQESATGAGVFASEDIGWLDTVDSLEEEERRQQLRQASQSNAEISNQTMELTSLYLHAKGIKV